MGRVLASAISHIDYLGAFDEMVESRLANLNVEAVLIYLIDIVDADALPILSRQFHVEGYEGYKFAETEIQKRELIKKAIELHRYKGTPWSIKEALKAVGYYNAIIEERLSSGIVYDGSYFHNGSQTYGQGHWADFRVIIDLGNNFGITPQTASDAIILINAYKNVRSRLRDVSYRATLQDYLIGIEEEISNGIESGFSDSLQYTYNGFYTYDGAVTYGAVTETLIVNIEP